MRRLPVYLLIDCSGSMMGEPIEAVKVGLQTMTSALRTDPYALETVHLSVITFSQQATQSVPLKRSRTMRRCAAMSSSAARSRSGV